MRREAVRTHGRGRGAPRGQPGALAGAPWGRHAQAGVGTGGHSTNHAKRGAMQGACQFSRPVGRTRETHIDIILTTFETHYGTVHSRPPFENLYCNFGSVRARLPHMRAMFLGAAISFVIFVIVLVYHDSEVGESDMSRRQCLDVGARVEAGCGSG